MKLAVALLALVAIALASDVPIVKQESDISPDGVFHYAYETGDGTSGDASGDANNVKGSFKFSSPEGEPFEVTYVADENGYQPTGAHIPAVPEAIARALEYLRAHPPKDAEHGAYVE